MIKNPTMTIIPDPTIDSHKACTWCLSVHKCGFKGEACSILKACFYFSTLRELSAELYMGANDTN